MTTIYVNPHTIQANEDRGQNEPPILVEKDGAVTQCHEVQGPTYSFVYRRKSPHPSGARVWFETDDELLLLISSDQ